MFNKNDEILCDCGSLATEEIDTYYLTPRYWYLCGECLQKYQDKDPDLNVESGEEAYARSWQEHQELHKR